MDPDGFDNQLGGDNFRDDDFHLKSFAGSFHQGWWLPDDAQSQCLDTGDPQTAFLAEP